VKPRPEPRAAAGTKGTSSSRFGADPVALVAVVAWIAGAAIAASLGLWSGMGTTAVVVGLGVLVTRWQALREMLRPHPTPILIGLSAGLLMALATHLSYGPISALVPFVKTGTAHLYLENASRPRSFGLLLVPIAIAEEVVWRGAVQTTLTARFGTAVAILAGAALYAACNAPTGAPVLIIAALGCGLVWGALRATTAGLVAPILAHLLWDEVLLFVAPLTTR
jgi:uncharacterized protein